jgi:hypothetical protein
VRPAVHVRHVLVPAVQEWRADCRNDRYRGGAVPDGFSHTPSVRPERVNVCDTPICDY